jgi:hypothetical protein
MSRLSVEPTSLPSRPSAKKACGAVHHTTIVLRPYEKVPKINQLEKRDGNHVIETRVG